MASILSLATAVPAHRLTAETGLAMAVRHGGTDERARRRLHAIHRHSTVEGRQVVLGEDVSPNGSARFYGGEAPTTGERLVRYSREAGPLALSAARPALDRAGLSPSAITHLVTVSCTGFDSPGVDFDLVGGLGLPASVRRLHVGFMGCHGLLNGLMAATAIAGADSAARVLVVAVELCSLHFQYGYHDERSTANALFADGAAAMVVGGDATSAPLRVRSSFSRVLTGTSDLMSWRIGDDGFVMGLSAEVPRRLREVLGGAMAEGLGECGLRPGDVAGWAVHPGGPRILDAVRDALHLGAEQLAVSRAILREFGNMSSPTVAFVLERVLAEGCEGPVVALAFGPGLALEALVLDAAPPA